MNKDAKYLMHAVLSAFMLCSVPVFAEVQENIDEKTQAPAAIQKASDAAQDERYELRHRLSTQLGYGPEEARLGEDRERFAGLRYEPTMIWYAPQREWATWQVFGRAWLNYSSREAQLPFGDEQEATVEGWSGSLRELYVRWSLLDFDPRAAILVGRQRYSDRYGIWWDDSLDSIKFEFNDTFSRGFFAVGEQLYRYNTDENKLAPSEDAIAYGFGEYALHIAKDHWFGVRGMVEVDHSDEQEAQDTIDSIRRRLGVFFDGEFGDPFKPVADYHVEIAALQGSADTASESDAARDESGGIILGEIGKRFPELAWKPRFAARVGLTAAPDSDKSGFTLNALQSDRVTGYNYSTGLLGSFIQVKLNNLRFYGLMMENAVSERHQLDFRLFDVYLDAPVTEQGAPISAKEFATTDNTSVGQIADITYSWNMFPVALADRQLFVTSAVNAGYFRAGDALSDPDNDFQVSASIDLRL